MASLNESKYCRISRSFRLSQAHFFSIGFKSGEYGGKNNTLQSYPFAKVCKTDFLWNVALSRIMVDPISTSFKRKCSNQNSNKTLSVVPLYSSGATHCPQHIPATRLVRLNFRPLIFVITFCPRGDLAYSRYRHWSIPVSSTYTRLFGGMAFNISTNVCR